MDETAVMDFLMDKSMLLDILLAIVLGFAIGLEREMTNKWAGLRTHILVCLGSCVFTLLSIHAFPVYAHSPQADPARIAAQILTGIGFIGAGTIIIHRQFVRGLTTAAGLWATAAIGLAVGGELYAVAVAATILTLAGLEVTTFLFRHLGVRNSFIAFSTGEKENLHKILDEVYDKGYRLLNYQVEHKQTGDTELFQVTMLVKTFKQSDETHLVNFIQKLPDLTIDKME